MKMTEDELLFWFEDWRSLMENRKIEIRRELDNLRQKR